MTGPRPIAIHGGHLWRGDAFEAGRVLLLAEGRIAGEVGEREPLGADYLRLDAAGAHVAPGFIDLLNHGSFGHAPEGDVAALARGLVQAGVTQVFPSLLSNPLPAMLAAARRIAPLAGVVPGGARIGGIHAEGPFFNPRFGGQKAENTAHPTPENIDALLDACGGTLRQVTLAPELPGAIEAIARLRAAGVVVSLGHSACDAATYCAARAAGLAHATHIMNALGQKDAGQPYAGVRPTGLEEWLLTDDGLTADLISDVGCVHVSAAWQRIVVRCKGPRRVVLVSDAMPCAGLAPGEHVNPDGQHVWRREGEEVARLENGLLYGSTVTLDRAVRNVMRATGVGLAEAVGMATANPARVQGLEHTFGALRPGMAADVVLFDAAVAVQCTIVAGEFVYQRTDD